MLRILTFLIAFTALFSLSRPAMANDATLQLVIKTVEQGYASLRDLQADFSQITKMPGLPKPQKGQGQLQLRRPVQGVSQFRFDYSQPRQSIISDGKQVWFYQPDDRQVMVSSLEQIVQGGNSIGMSYLTGLGNLSKDFNVRFAKPDRDQQGNYLLELTPRQPTQTTLLSQLRLAVCRKAVNATLKDDQNKVVFPIVSSTVIDIIGTETAISYSNIKTNSGLPASQFSFKVPKGVQIIKH